MSVFAILKDDGLRFASSGKVLEGSLEATTLVHDEIVTSVFDVVLHKHLKLIVTLISIP